jgi:hypothetical protein
MAEKHKSKYKKPENTKYKSRKDLKDYTMDDKDGKMNPKSSGEKQSNVLRKTDKPMVDDGKMDVKWNADDRLYKDLEDGEYDEKHAAKVLKKRQDQDETDNEKNIKDKIENLTREQKERLVREYVRRKITRILKEQTTPEEEPVPNAEVPAPTDPAATPAPTDPAATPAPTDPAATPAPAPTDPTATPAPDATATTAEPAPEEEKAIAVEKFVNFLKNQTGNIARIESIARALNSTFPKDAEPADVINFYKLLKRLSISKLSKLMSKDAEAQ